MYEHDSSRGRLLVGSLRLYVSFAKERLYVSFAKEPYKREDILQKRPVMYYEYIHINV